MSLSHEVEMALTRGELHEAFLEKHRLLSPDDRLNQQFDKEMQRIYDKLLTGSLGADYDKDKAKVRFALQVDDDPNASIFTSLQPPLIVFSSGLLKILQYESEIAAVLAHELGHYHFKDLLGDHVNNKLEELGSDLQAPVMLRDAGYPQRAMIAAIERLPDSNMDLFATLQDPHPTKHNRLDALETLDVALNKSRGTQQNAKDIPNNGIIKNAAQSAKFESYMDGIFRQYKYDRQNVPRKIEILQEVIEQELITSDAYYDDRYTDINNRIKALPLKNRHGEIENSIRNLTESLNSYTEGMHDSRRFTWSNSVEKLYNSLQYSYFGTTYETQKQVQPIGVFKDLQQAIDAFIVADDEKSIATAAKRLVEVHQELTSVSSSLVHQITFNNFSLPSYDDISKASSAIAPPWERHAQLSLNGNLEVQHALKLLAVNRYDERIANQTEVNLSAIQDIDDIVIKQTKVQTPLVDRDIVSEEVKYQVNFDDQGQITGVTRYFFDVEEDKQEALGKSRKAVIAEQRAIGEANWDELRTDFTGFIEQHRSKLIRTDYEDSTYPFAEKFVNEVSAILSENPDLIRNELQAFLSRFAAAEQGLSEDNTFRNLATEGKAFSYGKMLSLHHPIVEFVLEDAFHLFEPMEKIDLLHSVRRVQNGVNITDYSKIYPELPPESLEDLKQWVDKIQHEFTDVEKKNRDSDVYLNKFVVYEMIRQQTIETLARDSGKVTVDDVIFLNDIANTCGNGQGFREALVNHIDNHFQSIEELNLSASELIEQYKFFSAKKNASYAGPSLFSEMPKLRGSYQKEIQTHIENASNGERTALLESLLFEEKLTANQPEPHQTALGFSNLNMKYSGDIPDPAFRNWATFTYAESVVEHLGQDDKSPEYSLALFEKLENLSEHCSKSNAQAIIEHISKPALGNILQLQQENAGKVADLRKTLRVEHAMAHGLTAAFGEGFLETLTKHSTTQNSTIDFLTQPFTEGSALQFINRNEFLLREQGSDFLQENLSQNAKIEQMRLLHSNFWDMPFEMRTVAFKAILFPPKNHMQHSDIAFSNILDDVLDKVLPVAKNNNAKEGRQIVESYIEACSQPHEKRLLAAAMLASKEPSGSQEHNLSSGEALNLILDALGPAGRKLAQAIESHPKTPADIKASFANSKTMAVEPTRHQVMERIALYEAEHDEDRIAHVGKVLGAGSYGVTVAVTKASGEETAITFLHKDVRGQAKSEFETLDHAAEIMAGKNKRFTPLIEMVRQAQIMSVHETDMDLAAKQGEVASKLYDDVKVTVDGQTFTFGAAKFLSHGEEYKEFEIIEGDHFNDIARQSNDKDYVRRLATAQLTVELSHIFSGRPFDHDRHGGQQKIVENHIGQFDFGAMSVTETSPRQKQLIGHVIAGALRDSHLHKREFHQSLETEIEKCTNTAEERDFMAQVKRGILALGNFQEHIGGQDALKNIMGAVYVNNQMDEAIVNAMRERVGDVVANRMFAELEKAGKAAGITIEIPQQEFDKSPDKTPLAAPPKDTFFDKVPIEKEQAIEAAAGVTMATIGGLALMATNDNSKHHKTSVSAEKPGTKVNEASAIKHQGRIHDHGKMQERIIKGAACAAVAIGVGLAIDAATGRHAMQALSDLANRGVQQFSRA